MTGNFWAATAPAIGSTTCPPCVWPERTSGIFKRGRFGESSWIVRQQDDEAGRAAHDGGDVVASLRPEADSHQIDGFALDRDARSGVLQHLDAAAHQRSRHVVVVIVVAEDAEHAVRSRERAQRLG